MLDKNEEYNQYIEIIEDLLEKQRKKWTLRVIAWMDYEDVKQIIRIHIYKKWHLWDKSKPIGPWINRIISNQIKNLIRNNYSNYARPCLNCEHNLGGNGCSFTKSGTQESSCSLYKKWAEKKEIVFNLRTAPSIESHGHEIDSYEHQNLDIQQATDKIDKKMKKSLSKREYMAFRMLFIENKEEEDVAKYMGYRTSEKNRKAGYAQISNLKRMFKQQVKDMLTDSDEIIY